MTLHIAWEHDASRIDSLVQLFMANLPTSYISHSEVLGKRADTFDTWNIDLANVLHDELTQAFACDHDSSHLIGVMEDDGGKLLGCALIERIPRKSGDIAILSDLIIEHTTRGQGLGGKLLAWVEAELTQSGVRILLLESGIQNQRAHQFFQQHGYHITSVMMAKTLHSPN